jgi:glycosyltransferase involved in cell wall biosynthesis
MNYPKVSVLIITYNQKDFIRDTLDCVLNQEYPNIEIVVADDASTDGTSDIIFKYATLYPDKVIPVLADKNGGITVNSNRAFFKCTGEFIAILGGDDLFYAGKIKEQVSYMIKNPKCNLSYHRVRVFNSETNQTISISGGTRPEIHSPDEVISTGNFLTASSAMVRKKACPPGGFDERVPIASDWLFFFKTSIGGPILYIPEIYGAYRVHSHNVTKRSILKDCLMTLEIVKNEHPEFSNVISSGMMQVYINEAKRLFRFNQKEKAREILKEGLKSVPTSLRLWRYLIKTYF